MFVAYGVVHERVDNYQSYRALPVRTMRAATMANAAAAGKIIRHIATDVVFKVKRKTVHAVLVTMSMTSFRPLHYSASPGFCYCRLPCRSVNAKR